MEEIKKKRGRPKKVAVPEELEKVVDDIILELHKEFLKILEEEKSKRKSEWDFKKDDPIPYFDARLSYELTGYKPIDNNNSLDFQWEPFVEARETFKRTGHYCSYKFGTKAFSDFWDLQYLRCRDGMTYNGYTITGDHYFFLNFYQLDDLTSAKKAGGGRLRSFPNFLVELYKWFHYLELCKTTRKNAALMKARGVGFSEMDASLVANSYNSRPNTVNVIAALQGVYLDKTLDKVWKSLTFMNDYTDGGFFKLRQVSDSLYLKKASHYKVINGLKIEDGWMSQIQGIVADKPNKIRGDRTDLLFYEEGGSWPNSTKAFIQGDALVGIQGSKFGIKIIGGTGGDSGPALDGLRDIFYNPEVYDVLPYKHCYRDDNREVLTGFFIPAYNVINVPGLIDSRGYTDPEIGKDFYNKERSKKAKDPRALLVYCAEFCFTAEEAFALEGDNKFNKTILAELLSKIRALKICPPIETGYFTFNYKQGKLRKVEGGNIADVIWHNDSKLGKVKILEHPAWTQKYELDYLDKIQKLLEQGEDVEPYTPIPIQNAMYVAGVDGIDIGKEQTSEYTKDPSDFCIIIYKRVYGMQDPLVVAIYKDRPNDLREAYLTAIALAIYYNALINIEATRMSFCNWAKSVKFLNYFMKRPKATYPDINKIKSTQYGSPATALVINHQTDLIANFIEDYGHTLWFEEILDELTMYSDENKTKFDTVAALGMCMLADEELNGIVPKAMIEDTKDHLDIGYYKDEKGYTRFGLIPNKNKTQLKYNPNYYTDDTIAIRSSNPRVLFEGVW